MTTDWHFARVVKGTDLRSVGTSRASSILADAIFINLQLFTFQSNFNSLCFFMMIPQVVHLHKGKNIFFVPQTFFVSTIFFKISYMEKKFLFVCVLDEKPVIFFPVQKLYFPRNSLLLSSLQHHRLFFFVLMRKVIARKVFEVFPLCSSLLLFLSVIHSQTLGSF